MNTLPLYNDRNWLPKKNGNPAYMEHVNDLIKKINEIINEDAADNASLAGDNIFAGSNTFSENIQFAAGAYGVTAHAGGGQVGATPLTGMVNTVAVCAVNGDSCILPEALAGNFMIVSVSELTVGRPQVYPAVGEQIDSMGVNVPLTIDSGTVVLFSCDADGNWVSTSLYDIFHIYNAINTAKAEVVAPVNVTYAELQTLITTSALETGRQYCITDYATAYNIFDGGTNTVIEAQLGTAEPLIVLATGTATLAKEAYSELYPQDIIYYNPLVNAVERAAFIAAGDIGYVTAGSLVAGFKGIIEFRHDTKQNVSTWYDFRNIKFRRWAVDAVAYNVGTAYVAKDVCKSGVDGKIYKCITATTGEGDPTVNTADWILWWDIVADAYISWTSDAAYFNIGDITTTNLVFVPATYQDVYTFGDWYQHVNNVTIGKNDLALVMDYGYNSTLNNIVFKTQDNIYTCYSNEIGEISYNNTIGNDFKSNIIGDGFSSNTIGESFFNNTIGDNFSFNTIDNNFSSNTIGNAFFNNTIGTGFNSNTINTGFNSNTIGNDFNYNTIGNGFNSSTIGNNFGSNTIGESFNANTIGDRFYSNTISNNFEFNTIGNNFASNTIGNEFRSNTIGDDFSFNTIGNDFYSNTIGNSFNTNTIGNNSKVSVGINCQGNSIGDYNAQVTLGDNCTGISTGENNGTITLGAGCQNLTFKNGCTFTNTNATALKNTTFENGSVVNGLDFAAATHIKAAYSKTVFTNATPAVKLSYFDAANALTVVDVNA